MSGESIRDKALSLASEARRIGAGQQAEDNAHRVRTAVDELSRALAELKISVDVAHKLNEYGSTIDLTRLDDGLTLFTQRSGNGLPSVQAVNGACRTVSNVRTRINAQVKEAWASWCEARFSELRLERLPVLQDDEAPAAEKSLNNLRKLAKGEARAAAVREFAIGQSELRRQLDEAPDPEPGVLALLDRLRVGTTLDNLSDSDIALLRNRRLAGSIDVRRRKA